MEHSSKAMASVVVVLAALLAVGLSACSTSDAPRSDVATYEPAGPGGDAALLMGTLSSDGGCVTLIDDSGEVWLPVFPENASWTDDSVSVGGRDHVIGEPVELGGGGGSRIDPEWSIPDGCPDDVSIWVVAG
jgi:hypothetical protein